MRAMKIILYLYDRKNSIEEVVNQSFIWYTCRIYLIAFGGRKNRKMNA